MVGAAATIGVEWARQRTDYATWRRERATRWEERTLGCCADLHASVGESIRLISAYSIANARGDAEAASRAIASYNDERYRRSRPLVAQVQMMTQELVKPAQDLYDCVRPLQRYADEGRSVNDIEWTRAWDATRQIRAAFVDVVRGVVNCGEADATRLRKPFLGA